ncbi:MAG: NDP-sugar synthase [Gemmatimonadota bacterium]
MERRNLTLVILAAGLSTRFGRPKQLEAVGPSGEALLDYAIYDALQAGFTRVVLVIRQESEAAFKAHVRSQFHGFVEVRFVFQDPANLPAGAPQPGTRRTPWGTGHALLSAGRVVDGPFAAVNADDFYGATSYSLLAQHFRDSLSKGDPSHALIAYPLRDTLSSWGGVSRGICRCDAEGNLESLVEVHGIQAEGNRIVGLSDGGDPYLLTGYELASMNAWGFRKTIFGPLEKQFLEFLRGEIAGGAGAGGRDTEAKPDARAGPEAEVTAGAAGFAVAEAGPPEGPALVSGSGPAEGEFLLSTAIGEQVERRGARVRVIPARDPCFGLTFPADGPSVRSRINVLVARGDYPENLSDWFRSRWSGRGA